MFDLPKVRAYGVLRDFRGIGARTSHPAAPGPMRLLLSPQWRAGSITAVAKHARTVARSSSACCRRMTISAGHSRPGLFDDQKFRAVPTIHRAKNHAKNEALSGKPDPVCRIKGRTATGQNQHLHRRVANYSPRLRAYAPLWYLIPSDNGSAIMATRYSSAHSHDEPSDDDTTPRTLFGGWHATGW